MAEARPLAGYAGFSTIAVEEAREKVAKVYCDHRLDPLSGQDGLDAWQNVARLGSMSVVAMSYGAEVEISPGALGDFYLLMLPYAGSAEISHGRARMTSTERCGALLSPEDKTLMRWSADCAKIMLRIDRQALERRLSCMLDGAPAGGLVFDLALRPDDAMARWRRILGLLVEDLEASPDMGASLSAGLYESLLMASLLERQPHNFSARLSDKSASIAPRHVRAVEAYVEAHAKEPLSIEDLVAASGVSSRALFEGFRRFRGMSPLAYVRILRMRMAREELLKAEEGETVTSIATRWGFYQLGRFADSYRRAYGETPSQTLRRR